MRDGCLSLFPSTYHKSETRAQTQRWAGEVLGRIDSGFPSIMTTRTYPELCLCDSSVKRNHHVSGHFLRMTRVVTVAYDSYYVCPRY
ncbi:uncharacterized protein LACBIDRAFT_318755 [Laccaria bicolor S238N-H82]|uniref:Predicted protein n=1 Tax=Laccaria bicolor (strain S238N-H82 / ATCC MYA-4686) TaxID=486041 RepID=B0D705_LACBS|nr:uncharacterized protein LACBIDRAFT_318755 [Laccaria bicolor S238N-H82]EDR09567.1 predicted protein [Laccaria bicolor S238N-H82]|eukprot:XP_001879916.1 predicted protein [Laccaria bicolor S238N-H82]